MLSVHHCKSFQSKSKLSLISLLLITAATTRFTHIRAMSTSSTSTSKTNKPAALIFLHGLGDTPAGWSSLEHQLPGIEPSLANLKYVFPSSPTIPISINGGMTMPGWFDLYDWPIAVGVKDDHEGLSKAVNSVENCVKLLEEEGISRDRIAVGGFSQGAAVALQSAFSGKGSFAACVSLSGWVTFKDVSADDKVKKTPLFLGHGSEDDKVLFEQQQHAEITLMAQGVENIESKSYRMGHSSHPQEMEDMAKFLNKIFYESKE